MIAEFGTPASDSSLHLLCQSAVSLRGDRRGRPTHLLSIGIEPALSVTWQWWPTAGKVTVSLVSHWSCVTESSVVYPPGSRP